MLLPRALFAVSRIMSSEGDSPQLKPALQNAALTARREHERREYPGPNVSTNRIPMIYMGAVRGYCGADEIVSSCSAIGVTDSASM